MWLICRYLSQVRQELAVRLVARLYAGGSSTPSKVSVSRRGRGWRGVCANGGAIVVVEFHETEVYGEIVVRWLNWQGCGLVRALKALREVEEPRSNSYSSAGELMYA